MVLHEKRVDFEVREVDLSNKSASDETTSGLITLNEDANSLLDSDGSALVIHESADDYSTDPAGDSGDRVGRRGHHQGGGDRRGHSRCGND